MSNLSPSIIRCPGESFEIKAQIMNKLSNCRLHIDISFKPCDDGLIYYKNFTSVDRLLFNSVADFHLFNFEDISVNFIEEIMIPLLKVDDCVIFHIDNETDNQIIKNCINIIKLKNISVGIALDIDSKTEILSEYLKHINKVIIMGIPKGTYKRGLDSLVFEKKNTIRNCNSLHKHEILIGLDGGVTEENIVHLKQEFDFIVIGSVLFSNNNIQSKWINLKNI